MPDERPGIAMPPTRVDIELVAIHLVLLHRADWHAFDDLFEQPHTEADA